LLALCQSFPWIIGCKSKFCKWANKIILGQNLREKDRKKVISNN
jgi:hypothetical protein